MELNPMSFLKVTSAGICGTIYSTESHITFLLPPPTPNQAHNQSGEIEHFIPLTHATILN